MPIHATGRSVAKALRDVADYMENPHKTGDGELISTFECAPETLETEFILSKQRYLAITGRIPGKRDIIAYHARQSFKPGEITPEEANRIGLELARRFTKGRHAYAVFTHTDRRHIHNHIIWNSTALDCGRKFRNFIGSTFALRRCSDIICAENGLSVVRNPKPSPGRDYARHVYGADRPPSFQARLRLAVDAALDQKPATFEEFLALMRATGYVINDRRRHITFLAPAADGLPAQEKPTRLDTLRGDYTEEAIRERIAGRRIVSAPASKGYKPAARERFSLLIDIETKMREGKGPDMSALQKYTI